MNDRLEIASRIIAGFAAKSGIPPITGQEVFVYNALKLADALIDAEAESRGGE